MQSDHETNVEINGWMDTIRENLPRPEIHQ
jgi:hypothetical protein